MTFSNFVMALTLNLISPIIASQRAGRVKSVGIKCSLLNAIVQTLKLRSAYCNC